VEIIAEPGVGSDGPRDVSNEVKVETAGLGFRVKSGWAAVVLLSGPVDSPVLRDNKVIDLSDPGFPETRQPYHAAMGTLETDAKKTNQRTDVVRRTAKKSVTNFLADCRRHHYSITRASLVVGSQIDPALIANPHIRAHALEGQLFRCALEEALRSYKIHVAILLERDAYAAVAAQLKRSSDDVQRTIQNLRGSTDGPWRADQKLAALAAWVALCRDL
jgi:hypothetical protein